MLDRGDILGWTATLDGAAILRDDEAYDAARQVWNRAIDRRPAVIVRCGSVDDVRRGIEFAAAQAAPLAIRSGGHSQAGLGVCDHGIVLDLAALRGIAVDPGRRVVRVGAGARVLDVVDATQPYGLLTPMGGCPDVGVGGLTLGGGENFLMARYGAVVDNVVAADIVIADGRVLRASDDEHPDLFWALRGGGGNFGVVTSFEYRLHQVGEVLSGQMLFEVHRTRELLARYRDLMADAPDDLETSGGLTTAPDGKAAFFIALCWCGDEAAGERLVSGWRAALRPTSDAITRSPLTADLEVTPAARIGTGLFLPELTDTVIELFADAVAAAPPGTDAVWNEFHGAVTRVPVDATAFPLRRPGFDLFINVPWETPDDCAAALDWMTRLADGLRPFSAGVYVNNLSELEAHRVREAYGANVGRLAQVKARYDPNNLFRNNHNIRPA